MAILRPWYIRSLVKITGKPFAYNLHNRFIEKKAEQYLQQITNNLSNTAPAYLDEAQQSVYESLMTRGIAFADASTFLGDSFSQLLAVEQDYDAWVHQLPPITDTTNKKAYEQKRYAGPHTRQSSDVDIQLALNNRFAQVAQAYMHAPPKLFYCDYWHTVVSPANNRVASQNWHRDLEDKRLLKIFIYLNDINESNGAFEYVQYSALPLKYGQQFPHRLASSVYGEEMNKFIETSLSEYIIRGKGNKYTIVFADTTGFHRGGFAQQGERKLFHFFYTTANTPHIFGTVFDKNDPVPTEWIPLIRFAGE